VVDRPHERDERGYEYEDHPRAKTELRGADDQRDDRRRDCAEAI
jgi:hypothetical protein